MLPASLKDLANSPELLAQLRQAAQSLASHLRAHPEALERFAHTPMDAFLEHAQPEVSGLYSVPLRTQLNQVILADPRYAQKLAAAQAQLSSGNLGDGWASFWCQTAYWAAIVAAIGALIAISQGALIAPLIALQDGILLVTLAAITGLSEGTITTLAAAGGFTLEMLIATACGG
jgi:hypothetical protein